MSSRCLRWSVSSVIFSRCERSAAAICPRPCDGRIWMKTQPLTDEGTPMDRRNFLQAAAVLSAGAALKVPATFADESAKGAPHADKLGWRLGCQAWTFNRFTLFEAIDRTAELGLHFIEAYPHGQKLSPKSTAEFGPKMSNSDRKEVKKHLPDKGAKLVNMGVGPANREPFYLPNQSPITP